MNKIGLPICEDTLFKITITTLLGMVMFVITSVQYIVFSSGDVFGYVLGVVLFGFHYAFLMMGFMVFDKDKWIDYMIPFKLTGRCRR